MKLLHDDELPLRAARAMTSSNIQEHDTASGPTLAGYALSGYGLQVPARSYEHAHRARRALQCAAVARCQLRALRDISPELIVDQYDPP